MPEWLCATAIADPAWRAVGRWQCHCQAPDRRRCVRPAGSQDLPGRAVAGGAAGPPRGRQSRADVIRAVWPPPHRGTGPVPAAGLRLVPAVVAWPIAIPHRVPAVCGTSRGNGFINGFATIARHRTPRRTVPAAGGLSTPPTRKTPCACDVALTLILVTACVNATFSAPPRVAGARRQTRVGPW